MSQYSVGSGVLVGLYDGVWVGVTVLVGVVVKVGVLLCVGVGVSVNDDVGVAVMV